MTTTISQNYECLKDIRSANTIEGLKYLPLFPKANSILFNSGNIVSSNRLKKKTNLSSDEEVYS